MALEAGTKADVIQGIVRISKSVHNEFGPGFLFDPKMKNSKNIADRIIELGVRDKVINRNEANRLMNLQNENYRSLLKRIKEKI